jgi:hypothetical protein
MMQIANQVVLKYAKENLNLELEAETLSWESVTLFKDEIDTDLVPSEDLTKLEGDPLTILTTSFEDRGGSSYTFSLIVEILNGDHFKMGYAVCLKEGHLFAKNINWHQLLN